ncbi:MAG: DUF835 domain-containing protein [Thermoplasmata archaeon]|nr:DUF835 domain-containing protein [Thermoplasmata archaeon]
MAIELSTGAGGGLKGLYFISERRPRSSHSLFRQRTKAGEKDLFIARYHPDDVALKEELCDVECHWLLLREKENSVRPSDLKAVEEIIRSFFRRHKGGIALIDGVDILCLFNDFDKVVKLLNNVQSTAESCGGFIIVPVDDRALYPEDFSEISREYSFLDVDSLKGLKDTS